MANSPLIVDPVTRLIVEQPAIDPSTPTPGSLVLTNELGVVAPELANYVDPVLAHEPLPAGTWVNVFLSAGVKRARKASAEDQTKTAHGFVARDTPANTAALVYFTGPNRNVNTTIPGLTAADVGKPVYLSATNPGHVQKDLPQNPSHAKQFLGFVTDIGPLRSVVISKIIDQAGNIPSQRDQSGNVLSTDGVQLLWTPMVRIPATVGNKGKFLQTDGNITLWAEIPTMPPVGAPGTVLMSNGSTPQWSQPPGFANPMTTGGDLIVGGTSGVPLRLPRGDYRAVLGVLDNGTLGWTPRSIPDPKGQGGKLLASDGTTTEWVASPVGLPDQTTSSGKVLTTNGTSARWSTWALQAGFDHGSSITIPGVGKALTLKGGVTEEHNLLEGHQSNTDLTWFITDKGKAFFGQTLTINGKGTFQSGADHALTYMFPNRTGASVNVAMEDSTSLLGMLPPVTNQSGKALLTDGQVLLWGTPTVDLSTTETLTHKTWGKKPVWTRTLSLGDLTADGAAHAAPHGIPGITQVIRAELWMTETATQMVSQGGTGNTTFEASPTQTTYTLPAGYGGRTGVVILEYLK